jgi:sensor histidine kinase YesM
MFNSLFGTRLGLIAFSAWWVIVAATHTVIIAYFYNIPYQISIVDSLLSTILFAILSLGLWFWVRFSDIETTKPLTLLINHIGAALASIAIIIAIVNFSLSHIFINEPEYIEFLDSSIPARAITATFLYLLIALAFYLITYIQNYREKLLREGELKSLIKDAELNWLKLQLNPHFLFNSLNSISSLTMSAPEKAQDMIIRLSELLRYSLKQSPDSKVTLENELDNCIKYLEIEKIRFGSRLTYNINTNPDCLAFNVPAMIIQPLFENAIKHSVAQSPEQSIVDASIKRITMGIEIRISNTLHNDTISPSSTGVGLDNVRRRLMLFYGSSKLIRTEKTNDMFTAILIIPETSI